MFVVPVSRRASISPAFARSLDRLVDDALQGFFDSPLADAPTKTRVPALDVTDAGTAYTVKLDLPGVNKDDVTVDIEGRRVTVQATVASVDERKEGERLLYRERVQSCFARSFTLPQEVQQADAVAKLEAGVLTLTLPKRAAARLTVN